MPLEFKCPKGHAMLVKEEWAGKKIRCPKCQMTLVVPARGQGTLEPPMAEPVEEVMDAILPDLPAPAQLRRDEKRKKRERRQGLEMVRLGLAFHIAKVSLWLITSWGVFLVFLFDQLINSQPILSVATLIGIALSATGTVFCIWVPRDSGCWGRLLAALILEGIAALGAFAYVFLYGLARPGRAEATLGGLVGLFLIASFIVFVLFLKALAAYARDRDLESGALVVLILLICLIVAVIVLPLIAREIVTHSGPDAIKPVAWCLIIVLLGFSTFFNIRYLWLLQNLRSAV